MVCALKGIENVIEVIAKALDWRTTISDKCPYDPGFAPDFQNVCADSDLPQYMVSSSERVAEREDLEGSVASYWGVGRIGRCCRKGNYYCCLGWRGFTRSKRKEKGNNARKDRRECLGARAFERRVENDRCDAGSFTNPGMSDICFKAL